MKNVQIPFDLFLELYTYFVYGTGDKEAIQKQIEEKAQKIVNHENYSRYINGDSEAEREKARRDYLDAIEMPKDFRW